MDAQEDCLIPDSGIFPDLTTQSLNRSEHQHKQLAPYFYPASGSGNDRHSDISSGDLRNKRRVIAYFDGSNFYHYCKNEFKTTKVDFKRICDSMLNREEELVDIKYFIAPVSQQEDPDGYSRQLGFLNRVRSTSLTEVHLGKLMKRPLGRIHITCPSCGHQEAVMLKCPKCSREISVRQCYKLNEKGVDVQMAMAIILDTDSYDTILLFSNDADFTPALKHIVALGKKAVYCSFPRMPTGELLQACSENRIIKREDVESRAEK